MYERRVERSQVVEPAGETVVDEVAETAEGQVVHRERVAPAAGVVHEPAAPVAATPNAAVVAPPAAAADVDQVSATAYDPYAARRRTAAKLVQIVWLLFGIIEAIIAIRFILRLFGANEGAPFAAFIYQVSGAFLLPFAGLFATPRSGGSALDLNALVGLVVYMLLAWLFAKIVWLLAGESRSATTAVANSTRTRVVD
jgi:hypothetical protein